MFNAVWLFKNVNKKGDFDMNKNLLKAGVTGAALAAAMTLSPLANAAFNEVGINAFSDDFQSYTIPGSFDNWAFFSDNAGAGGYFNPAANTDGGAAISSLANDGAGNQYLNFYANYGNDPAHQGNNPNPQEAISIFHEFGFTGADVAGGETWVFSFDYALNPPNPITDGATTTEVGAFIRVLDNSNNLLDEVTFDTRPGATDVFQSASLQIDLNPGWVQGGKLQIGFNNLVGEYNGSGRFYDNVNFDVAPVPLPAAAWLFGSALIGLVGLGRRRKG